MRTLRSTFYDVCSRSEDWDSPKAQRRPRDEVSRDHENLRFSNDLWRLRSLCSGHQARLMSWRKNTSSKQEAPLTGDTPVSEQGWVVHADTSVSVPDAEARIVTSNSTVS